MLGLVILFAFIFGTIIGSFLNVLILRYNTGRGVSGRSACFSCGAPLRWYELLPIVSFALQGRRCRHCGARISWQYPLVELLTGSTYAALLYSYWKAFKFTIDIGLADAPFVLAIMAISAALLFIPFCLLIFIAVYDFRHKIIPNGPVWAFIIIAFVFKALELADAWPAWQSWFPEFLAGPILALPFLLIWFVTKGRAMGFGDAKLALGIGWFLGAASGASAIILSFWLGGIVGIFLLARRRFGFTLKSEVPFAPFMVAGTYIALFFGLDILGLTRLLN